jgi:hypothetical protein
MAKRVKIEFVSNPTPAFTSITIAYGVNSFTLNITFPTTVAIGANREATANNYFTFVDAFAFPTWLNDILTPSLSSNIVWLDFDVDNLYYNTVDLNGYVFYKNGKILNYNQLKYHMIFNKIDSSEVTYENIPVMVIGYKCKLSGKFIEKNVYDAYVDVDLKFEQFKNQELLEYFTY